MNGIKYVFTLILIGLLWMPTTGFAAQVDLAWQAPTTNEDGSPLSDLAGYLVYYGTVSGVYSPPIDVGNSTSHLFSISDQEALGRTYYFAVTARDTSGNESSFSNEVPHYFSPGPSPEVCNGVDDDGDGSIDEGCTTYYMDADVDSYGNSASWVSEMSQPGGYVTDSTDCDDTRSSVNPGATELCNGRDDDCDGTTDEGCSTYYNDSDNDGFGDPGDWVVDTQQPSGHVLDSTDCDDTRSSVNPGATELCNGRDDDCDGTTDEGCRTYYLDGDGDGYGDPGSWTSDVSQPTGYVTDSTDCDDTSETVHPGATETCNGVDENCNSQVDEGMTQTFYPDQDNDNYGIIPGSVDVCSQPAGFASVPGDCDDTLSGVNPVAVEVCNGQDDNCDGTVDEGCGAYYRDADIDGYGDQGSVVYSDTPVPGYVEQSTDCDDSNSSIYPGAAETCNGVDDNCNGTQDEGCIIYYRDSDSDGYGDQNVTVSDLSQPPGYVGNQTDCNDGNSSINPGATEICNGVDDNCSGAQDEGCLTFYRDADGDNYGDPGQWLVDINQPSGYVSDNSDCSDSDTAINPGATEACNAVDDDCDGSVDEGCGIYYRDSDSDGYGDQNVSVSDLLQPPGYVGNQTDCNDTDSLVYPGAAENCSDLVDNDCDGLADAADADCASAGPNTPAGLNVTVQPVDPATGADFVQVTFEEVMDSGDTRLGVSQNGPKPPNGYKVSNPHSTFDLSTTALFNGLIETCIDYNGLHFGNEKKMKVFHRIDADGDGTGDTWEDVTTYHDLDGNIICGVADTFSSFGVFEEDDPYAVLSEGAGSGGCFIATAAYGSYLDPHVKTLRRFRDNHLLTNIAGRHFVKLYYRYSPPAARWLAGRTGLKSVVRVALLPLVAIAWLLVNAGTEAGLLLLGLVCILMTLALRRGYTWWHGRQGGVSRA